MLTCVPIEDSDQPEHPHSLIRILDGCSMGSQGSNRKLNLIDCADA